MKIAFNPSTVEALTTPPNNKDITFDLRGHNIFARGVKFCGTDTNTWRDIKINNVSIDSNTLDLRDGSNTTLTNINGVVTINSTWRPVVDNLTSDSTTSSLSANQGRILVGLINGKSDSEHNHDDRYVKKTGDTMFGALNFANGTWNLVGDDSYMGDCNISGHFGIKAANTTYPGISFFNNANAHLGNLTAYSGNIKYGAYSLQFLDNGNTNVSAGTWMNPFNTYNASAVADGQAICVWGQSSYLSNLAADSGDMSLWLKRVNSNVATLNMVLDGEYYANGNQRLAHVSEIPNSLKNPYALTISLNGTSQGPYDGSAAKNINITPSSIGAATSDHNHDGRYVRYYAVTTLDCNNLAPGLTTIRNTATNSAVVNHSAFLYISDVGTPFQIQIPDSNTPYIFKRSYSSGGWSGWFKLNAGYADSAGSIAWDNVTGKPSSYIPSAHTHSWISITEKLVAGNEFNIVNAEFNGDIWFNYIPINDRSKTATVLSYIFGNGHKGLALVQASGFVKTGSSSSYVLLGDGGHKLESSLNVASASVASKVYGQVGDTGSHELVRCDMNNDQFRIIAGSNGNNNGWAEIATADDGSEPIYVRQYTGVFSSVKRTLTLLDANGYTHFPSYINIGGNENNNSSPDRVWGSNSSDSYLRSYRTSALNVNYASSAGNADTVDGYHSSSFLTKHTREGAYNIDHLTDFVTRDLQPKSEINIEGTKPYDGWGIVTVLKTDNGTAQLVFDGGSNFYFRSSYGTENRYVTSGWNQVASLNSNVASATKLQTPRSIWGQSFDGTADVNGTIYINNNNSSEGAIRLNNNINSNARISAIDSQVIFNTGNAIRFGETDWDWNQWAGLKYTHSNKTIYLGIADGSVFNSNSSQSGGTLNLRAGISNIDLNSGTSIRGLPTNGSPYSSRIALYDTSISLSAYGGISMSTGPGAIELSSGYGGIKLSCQGNNASIDSEGFKVEASRGVYLNSGNSGNVYLCQGGKVGIGTTAPAYKLDVVGNIRATGQIIREGSGQTWVNGRNGALLRETSVAGYHTLWSLKTTNGSWDFGEYNAGNDWDNIPVLSYITDSNYNSGNNTPTYQIRFPLASGTVALTSNIPNPNNYYWANVKISTSSSTTTSPTVSNLTATNSIKMGNILLEHTDEINNSTNGWLHLNYRNSGNISLCYGGGTVSIGTVDASYKLSVMGNTCTKGFIIRPCYLSIISVTLSNISPGDGYVYRCLEIGSSAEISCIIADKVALSNERGVLIKFNTGYDGQIVLLKDLQNYGDINGNGYFWVMPSGCKIIRPDGSSTQINYNQISNAYDDGKSRFFVYSFKYNAWIEFYCS